ncbi:MAG: DUF4255 domain-containing protein [Bacteroidetes bacterium]|nr:DUF4255 domain-containing protein [Bacteroidota bacterium]
MINLALDFIASHIEKYLQQQQTLGILILPGVKHPVILGNVSQVGTSTDSTLQNMILVSLVKIEEDRISRSPDNYVRIDQQVVYRNPPVYLNLDVLFTANFENYRTSLLLLSSIIQFFQYQNVFTPQNSPDLPQGIEELIFDMKTLSLQDLNNLWAILGSKYIPSVLYKMRLIKIMDTFTRGSAEVIKEIKINDEQGNPA